MKPFPILAIFFLLLFSLGIHAAEKTGPEEIIQSLEKNPAALSDKTFNGDLFRKFEEACKSANEAQCGRLTALLAKVPPESIYYNFLSPSLLAAEARLATDKFREHPTPLKFQSAAPEPAPQKISRDLAATWNFYRGVSAPYLEMLQAAEKKPRIFYQENRDSYAKLTNDLLSQKAGIKAEDFIGYYWGGGCGTGSETFTQPNGLAIFLSLLQEKRIPEAVGAALQIEHGMLSESPPLDAHEFLSLATPDWEKLVAGALTESFLRPGPNNNQPVLLAMLGRHGTEKTVPRLIELAALGDDRAKCDIILVLGLFLNTPPAKDGKRSVQGRYFADLPRIPPPASPEAQQQILAFFDQISQDKAPFNICESVAIALAKKDLPATRPLLQRLLHHPSEDVANAAAGSLSSLGETFTPPTAPAPVSFCIQLNGQSLKNHSLNWSIGTQKSYTSSTEKTDTNGVLFFRRKYFIDPSTAGGFVDLATSGGTAPTDPLFTVNIPQPTDLDQPKIVPIKTRALELRFSLPAERPSNKNQLMTVVLRKNFGDTPHMGTPPSITLTLPSTDSIRFTQLQEGAYDLKVNLPGAVVLTQVIPNLDSGHADIKMALGSDVRMNLIVPEGWKPYSLKRILLHNGQEMAFYENFNYETGGFSGLPVGDYVLRIPSSKEQNFDPEAQSKKAKAFEGREIPFRIDAQSPNIIDLGEIRLKSL